MSKRRTIIANTTLLSLGRSISMGLGLVRNILVAYSFGTSATLEAFIVAFRLPNLMRSIVGEGFSESVATPVLSEFQNDKDALFRHGSVFLSFSVAFLTVATLVGILTAKWLVILIAPGFLSDGAKFAMTVSFTRTTFLYLFFIGLSVNSFSLLHVLKRFFVPAVTPAFLNIAFIIGLLFFGDTFGHSILVVCVLVGGVAQVIIPFLALRSSGFVFNFHLKGMFKDRPLKSMLRLCPPRMFSSITYQVSVILDTVLASFAAIVGQGALVALWFANHLIHLPLALFVHSVAQVAVVDLSFYHGKGDLEQFKKLLVFSFQNIVFFIIPIAVWYLFLSRPIVDVMLHRGDFNLYSLAMTSSVLFYYSFGLFFFCVVKLLVNVFYALKNTLIPAQTMAISLGANVLLSVGLMFPLGIGGVALGSSLAALLNAVLLYRKLRHTIGAIDWEDTPQLIIKVILLSVASAALGLWLWQGLEVVKYLKAGCVALAVASSFIGGGYLLGLRHIHYFKRWVSAKR